MPACRPALPRQGHLGMVADNPEHSSPDVGQLRLTYAQIAERLHISGDAARVLVRRRGWFRIIPNKRGQPTVVVVPAEDLAAEQGRRTRSPDVGGVPPDSERRIDVGAVALLDRALSRLIEAERRADAERARAEELQRDLEAARVIVRAAQRAAAEEVEQARGEAKEARQ